MRWSSIRSALATPYHPHGRLHGSSHGALVGHIEFTVWHAPGLDPMSKAKPLGGSYEYGMEPISTMPMGLDAWTLANEAVLTSFVYYIRFLRCRCASRERAMSLVTQLHTN